MILYCEYCQSKLKEGQIYFCNDLCKKHYSESCRLNEEYFCDDQIELDVFNMRNNPNEV